MAAGTLSRTPPSTSRMPATVSGLKTAGTAVLARTARHSSASSMYTVLSPVKACGRRETNITSLALLMSTAVTASGTRTSRILTTPFSFRRPLKIRPSRSPRMRPSNVTLVFVAKPQSSEQRSRKL